MIRWDSARDWESWCEGVEIADIGMVLEIGIESSVSSSFNCLYVCL